MERKKFFELKVEIASGESRFYLEVRIPKTLAFTLAGSIGSALLLFHQYLPKLLALLP